MFFPLTQQDYAQDENTGELMPYRRLVMIPFSVVELIEELQADDAEKERERMYGWGARTVIELRNAVLYVVEPIGVINELTK